MTSKEAKPARILLRVIHEYANEHNIRLISKMADEGLLRTVRNLRVKA